MLWEISNEEIFQKLLGEVGRRMDLILGTDQQQENNIKIIISRADGDPKCHPV